MQPEFSKILRGKFSGVSLERLMRFLTALGRHIESRFGAAKVDKVGDVTIIHLTIADPVASKN
jgi:hypothetical protein